MELTASPINVGLPPFDIAFDEPLQTGAAGTPSVNNLGTPYPNPFNPVVTIPFTLTRPAFVRVDIYDVLGQTRQKARGPSV